jgi:hypothetical protein
MRALKWSTRALHALEQLVLPSDFTSFDGKTGSEIARHEAGRLAAVEALYTEQLRKRVPKGLRRRFPTWKLDGPMRVYRTLLAVGKCGHGTAREICVALGFDVPSKKRHQCVCRTCGARFLKVKT